MIMAYKVLDIANKLLLRAKNNESGDLMSNMKLQKMLYYQQGFQSNSVLGEVQSR